MDVICILVSLIVGFLTCKNLGRLVDSGRNGGCYTIIISS